MAWYEDAHLECLARADQLGVDFSAFVGVVSALSPQMRWEDNIVHAFLTAGDPTYKPPTYGSSTRKARAILAGQSPEEALGGPKTRAFYRCIVDPDQRELVAIDRHQIRLLFPTRDDKFRSKMFDHFYKHMEELHVLAADRAGIAPAQLQAITWLVQREAKD